MRLLQNRDEALSFYNEFVWVLEKTASLKSNHRVTFRRPAERNAPSLLPTYFYADYDFWVQPTDGSFLEKSKSRYWNCFGRGGTPETATKKISIEINHPHDGINNRITGGYLVDGNDLYLGHTGKIGGGSQAGNVWNFKSLGYSDHFESIKIGKRQFFLISKLEKSEKFVSDLAKFVHFMQAAREGRVFQ